MKEIIASGKGVTGKMFLSSNMLYYLSEICAKSCIGVDAMLRPQILHSL